MVSLRRVGPSRRLVRISLLSLVPIFTFAGIGAESLPASASASALTTRTVSSSPSSIPTLAGVEALVSAALCDVDHILTGDIGPGSGPCGFPGLG